ncbi:MAG TPA: hypothetical protein VHZ55_33410 [Bryobacteraceae bacterium]|nr:hypothetical protein [Bryobacteraceae bacterium]
MSNRSRLELTGAVATNRLFLHAFDLVAILMQNEVPHLSFVVGEKLNFSIHHL